MQTLQELSTETIRKNWNTYKDIISPDNHFYNIIWNDLYKKFEFEKSDEISYVTIFRDFIEGKEIKSNNKYYHFIKDNNKTLIIKGMDGDKRKIIHKLCDKLGLHHNSVPKNKKKHLYIYIPDNWSFEYTERNPYSKDDEYYQNLELLRAEQRKEREEKEARWLRNKECYECGTSGLHSQLFESVYIRNIYCEDCLDIVSDGGGYPLNCHKFEPISYNFYY